MASLFADENFPVATARHLRRLGHDVLTCSDVGLSNRRIPDDIVLEFACRLDRAVLTLNRNDFVALHERGVIHAGIIACEEDADFKALALRIHAVVTGETSISGRLIEVRM